MNAGRTEERRDDVPAMMGSTMKQYAGAPLRLIRHADRPQKQTPVTPRG